jgi:hypothetical protein
VARRVCHHPVQPAYSRAIINERRPNIAPARDQAIVLGYLHVQSEFSFEPCTKPPSKALSPSSSDGDGTKNIRSFRPIQLVQRHHLLHVALIQVELIVIDNPSTDPTPSYAPSFGPADLPLVLSILLSRSVPSRTGCSIKCSIL